MIKYKNSNSYMSLDAWVMANVVQLWTDHFCSRFVSSDPRYRVDLTGKRLPVRANPELPVQAEPESDSAPIFVQYDPTGRQYDQMTQAARSGVTNIAEGSARHSTGRATEMKLLDVALASLQELKNDYLHFMLLFGCTPWPRTDANAEAVLCTDIQRASYSYDWDVEAAEHIMKQKAIFNPWLYDTDGITAARALYLLCTKAIVMLQRLIDHRLEEFRKEGGFAENLSQDRNETLVQQSAQEGAPTCPICGAPMLMKTAQRGSRAGKRFWSCSNYQSTGCKGTRNID